MIDMFLKKYQSIRGFMKCRYCARECQMVPLTGDEASSSAESWEDERAVCSLALIGTHNHIGTQTRVWRCCRPKSCSSETTTMHLPPTPCLDGWDTAAPQSGSNASTHTGCRRFDVIQNEEADSTCRSESHQPLNGAAGGEKALPQNLTR